MSSAQTEGRGGATSGAAPMRPLVLADVATSRTASTHQAYKNIIKRSHLYVAHLLNTCALCELNKI